MNHADQVHLTPDCTQLQLIDDSESIPPESKKRATPRRIPGLPKSEQRGFIASDRKLVDGSFLARDMLGDLRYWLEPDQSGKCRSTNRKDGHTWAARSRRHWMALFDVTEQEVKTGLKYLLKDGVVIRESLEFGNWDTYHYRINFDLAGFKLYGAGDQKGVATNPTPVKDKAINPVASNPTPVSSNPTPVASNPATSGSTQEVHQEVLKTLGGASLGPTPEPAPDQSGNTNPANPTPDPKPETAEIGKQEPEGTTLLDTPKGKSPLNKITNQLTGEYVDRLEAVWKLQPGHVSKLSPTQRGKLRNYGEKLLAAGLDPLRVLHALVTTPPKWKAFAAAVHAKYQTYKDKPNIDVLGTTKYLDVLINWVIETRKQKAEQTAKSAAQAAAKGPQVGMFNPTPAKPTSGPGAFTPEEWAARLEQREAYLAFCAMKAVAA